jgi:membrane protein YdbS with pleckstrin-like domain
MNKQHDPVWVKILGKDEIIKEEFSVGKTYRQFSAIVWSVLLGLPTVGIGAIFPLLYYFFYLPKANKYAFTNKRILIHRGWLSTNLTSVDYSKITDVFVRQGFFEKTFTSSGTIAVNTAGSGGEEVVLNNVANPYTLKRLLDELKDN